MKSLLILDTETNGLGDDAVAIEVGAVLWSVEHRSMLTAYSALLPAEHNAALGVNRIPVETLPRPASRGERHGHWDVVEWMLEAADCWTAWHADFDVHFLEPINAETRPRFCAMDDLDWSAVGYPKDGSKSLISVALWHHCGVASAHRALDDCLLLARLLEAVARDWSPPEAFDRWLDKGLARGTAPRARFVSLAPFEEKETVKAAGFKWNEPGFERQWSKVLPVEEAKALPFRVRQVEL